MQISRTIGHNHNLSHVRSLASAWTSENYIEAREVCTYFWVGHLLRSCMPRVTSAPMRMNEIERI